MPTVSDFEVVVPSEVLLTNVVVQNANNNLDVAWHNGQVFLAFRTAPNHFANDKTVIYALSSTVRLGKLEHKRQQPLSSVVPPKICPKCDEKLNAEYSYHPSDETKLPKED